MGKTGKAKNRRPQASKNPELAAAMRDLRRSSAASPHRNKAKYNRKSKYNDLKEF